MRACIAVASHTSCELFSDVTRRASKLAPSTGAALCTGAGLATSALSVGTAALWTAALSSGTATAAASGTAVSGTAASGTSSVMAPNCFARRTWRNFSKSCHVANPRQMDVEAAAEAIAEAAGTHRVRRPWCCFFSASLVLVFLFAAGGPVRSLLAPPPIVRYRPHRWDAAESTLPPRAVTWDPVREGAARAPEISAMTAATGIPAVTTSAPTAAATPAPTTPAPTSSSRPDGRGAADPGGASRAPERSPLVQGMIEAGFSRTQAESALAAVDAKSSTDIPRAIRWQLQQGADRNKAEAGGPREAVWFANLDLDGYAETLPRSRIVGMHAPPPPAGMRSAGATNTARPRSLSAPKSAKHGPRSRPRITRATSSCTAASRSATRPLRCRRATWAASAGSSTRMIPSDPRRRPRFIHDPTCSLGDATTDHPRDPQCLLTSGRARR